MSDLTAEAVLAGINRVLADGGADGDAVGMRVATSETGFVVSFDTSANDPRVAVVSRISLVLSTDEAKEVARADRYTAPRVLLRKDHGVILSAGPNLPGGLALEIDEIVAAAVGPDVTR